MGNIAIDFVTPVAPDRDLGREYNRVIRWSKRDWICITDCDVAFLTPMDIVMAKMGEYIEKYPGCGLFTCLTNRIYEKSQLFNGRFSDDHNMLLHVGIAKSLIEYEIEAKICPNPISGFMMLVNRETWKDAGGFREGGKLLGVDNKFGEACRNIGSPPHVMQTIYVFHLYRMGKDRYDSSHLS